MAEDSRDSPSLEEAGQRAKRRTRLSAKRKAVLDSHTETPQLYGTDTRYETKRKRTFADFFSFCNFVLAYEEKLAMGLCVGGPAAETASVRAPPPHSAGESSLSPSSSSSSSSSSGSSSEGEGQLDQQLEYTSDDESWNLVTCFCRRPFAGRPMVECASCQTWIHLFCAKLKRSEIPDVYICPKCSSKENSEEA